MTALGATHNLHLELRFDGAAPVGHVCLAGREPHAFAGWVGLVNAVDDLAPGPRAPTHWRRHMSSYIGTSAIAAVAAVSFPATAFGADDPAAKVLRIDPSTGARTVLAGSPYWHALTGIAVAPSGTIYVSAQGGSSGVFSLTAPGFAIAQLAKTTSEGLALSGQTLYSLNPVGPVSIDTNAPFAGKVVEQDIGKSLAGIAASGATVYGTWADGCTRGASAEAAVAAIDTATGLRKDVADLVLCPEEPRGIAVAPDGTLVVATATRILRVNPADGSSRTLSRGGLLRNAGKLAVTSSGDVIVADASTGILRITPTGRQSTIASGRDLIGVDAVALDAAGKIYVTTPPGSPLQASAPGRQRYKASRGIRVSVGCHPLCYVGYQVKVTGVGRAYSDSGGLNNKNGNTLVVNAKRTAYIKLEPKANRRIADALSRNRAIKVTLNLTPQTDHGDDIHGPTTLTVRLVR